MSDNKCIIKKEQEYLYGLLDSTAAINVDRFKIKWIEENKYILGVSSTDPKNMLGKVSKYLAFNTSIYENDFSIKYSLKKALHIWCLWQDKPTYNCSAKVHNSASSLGQKKKPLRAS